MLGDGSRGSILMASPFSYSSTIGVPVANCYFYIVLGSINTWYMVPVPSIIRGTRGLRIIRKSVPVPGIIRGTRGLRTSRGT